MTALIDILLGRNELVDKLSARQQDLEKSLEAVANVLSSVNVGEQIDDLKSQFHFRHLSKVDVELTEQMKTILFPKISQS